MSQECPTSNPNAEHPGGSIHVFPPTSQPVGQAPHTPTEEASMILPTPNRYWRLFNDPRLAPPDPGLSPITPSLGPPVVTTEAFLGLTQQVQALIGMIEAIVPCIPQLAQAPTHQLPHVPRQAVREEAPQSRSSQGEHPGGAPRPPVEAAIENPNISVSQPLNRPRDVMRLPSEPDVVSSYSTNSVREQLRQVNQRIDEPYGGSTDSTEHVTAFRAQMALYDTSDALMCCTFPMTLRGSARMWYSRIKPFSISSFDQFAKEFELNFIASSCPRPTVASLLGLTQGNDEPLAQFVSRFSGEIRRMPDTHPTMVIQAFLMGLWPSRFFWSLIERPPSTVPEMLQRASQYVTAESLVARKREDHKKS
ncbi:hypothetical protein BHM03_00053318 [Ensete ventricosum]|nr:hypothetical protein BHM03_00053318 [Ensete ventricosum]